MLRRPFHFETFGSHEDNLVDEYGLLLFPVVLGAGKRLFDERGTWPGFG